MFERILIANRGEIACRVIRTARRMGIETVAVHSEVDAREPHVAMADHAVNIGPAPASASYLDIERVVRACEETGADAVHPGYGFLSERAEFVRALDAAGITFIGPPSSAIELMGDKIESKRFAASAGVNVVPGFDGVIADPDEAVRVARDVGYPVMIKASAGGGGKGMRIAHDEAEVRDGFERARSEAASSFGDDRVFIERFVTDPRHIEIQVLADRHDNCIHLLERECSVQRRNQKVLEEAPSVFLDPATRAAMGEQAVALARAVDYVGAGTVEFIVDGKRNFFFLEMNTRLQVEHPVTELVTGVDLVEQMILAAAGEPLTVSQDDIEPNGWAIEARVYAEDPARGFLPSIGRLSTYAPPHEGVAGGGSVRVDDGVREGSEVTVHYDPMIAKLCAWGPDRETANETLRGALDGFAIEGVTTNLDFLSAIVRHERWRRGELTTAFIAEEFPDGHVPTAPTAEEAAAFDAIAVDLERAHERRLGSFVAGEANRVGVLRNDGAGEVVRADYDVSVEDEALIVAGDDGGIQVEVADRGPSWAGHLDGSPVRARARREAGGWRIARGGHSVHIRVVPRRIADLTAIMPKPDLSAARNEVRSPMPGTVVSVAVSEGDRVVAGSVLAIVEAMKMENVLRAEREGTIDVVAVGPGDAVAVDQVLMRYRTDEGTS